GIPQRVSPQTMHVLLHAKRLWIASGGLFDPTVGPLVRAWGFQGDSGAVPSSARLDSLRALVGYQRVELDSAQGAVCLTRAGVRLDLGGIAKGYALDLARAALTDPRITGGMVDLGGNVLVFGRPPTGTQWVIGIRHPRYADRVLGTVSLDSGAVATSGDYEHFIRVRGVRYGHLIDPFTGYPRRGVMAATAIGPRGEWSDGVSGTLFLTGARRGAEIADSLSGVGGVWVLDRGRDRVRAGDIVSSRRARETFHFTVTGCSDTSSRPARRTSRRPADRRPGSRLLRSDEGGCA
ncbi:MAG TPA: FAD:protein FMN transferase, partial [Gemmatimonadaceae bacterium]